MDGMTEVEFVVVVELVRLLPLRRLYVLVALLCVVVEREPEGARSTRRRCRATPAQFRSQAS